jgi:hypothetical protein
MVPQWAHAASSSSAKRRSSFSSPRFAHRVHIPVATLWAHYKGGDVDAGLAGLAASAGALIDDLLWWTAALKAARARAS